MLRIALSALLLICCGWFLYTRPDSFNTRSLCSGFGVFIFAIAMEFAVKHGYLKVRSQDSWLRIIGEAILIIAAAFLVIAVATFVVLGLQ